MRHRLESMSVPRSQPMRMCMMSLRKVYAKLPDAKEAGYKAGDFFLQYRKNCVARPAMEQVLSALMCSFCRMWKYLVRIVMEADITGTLGILKGKQSLESYILCRN